MRGCIILILLFSILFCAPNVYAVSLSVDSYPQKITTAEFEITVSIVGAKSATNYLKILLYKENTHSYLSETWNGSSWYSGSDGKQYLPVTIAEKTTTAQLKGRLGEGVAPGEYRLSVKRYTASGSQADDSVNAVVTTVETGTPPKQSVVPAATPTPSPLATPSPTPQQTSVPTTERSPAPPVAVLAATTIPSPVITPEDTMTPLPATGLQENLPQESTENTPQYSMFALGIVFFVLGIMSLGWGISGIIKVFTHEGSHRFL